jgi:spore germination protein KC
MKTRTTLRSLLIIMMCLCFLSGCWNYKEVDELAIVGGAAIDKTEDGRYEMTVETIEGGGSRDTMMKSKVLTGLGKTLFDAARNLITISGKRLYWSHTQIIILSQETAREGVMKVIDWYSRDAETREDVTLLVSREATAKEILMADPATEQVVSITLGHEIDNNNSIGTAPIIDIMHFDIESQLNVLSSALPVIGLTQVADKRVAQIIGSAIIKDDKLVGFLDGEETKYLNFIKDEIKKGIFVIEVDDNGNKVLVSLEMFMNKTNVKPIVSETGITMSIVTDTSAAIGEINGAKINLDEAHIKAIEKTAERTLESRICEVIKKVREEYGADIFGFASTLYGDDPKTFEQVKPKWEEYFKSLDIDVHAKFHIKNTATISKYVEEGV